MFTDFSEKLIYRWQIWILYNTTIGAQCSRISPENFENNKYELCSVFAKRKALEIYDRERVTDRERRERKRVKNIVFDHIRTNRHTHTFAIPKSHAVSHAKKRVNMDLGHQVQLNVHRYLRTTFKNFQKHWRNYS